LWFTVLSKKGVSGSNPLRRVRMESGSFSYLLIITLGGSSLYQFPLKAGTDSAFLTP
jgi:hypothetical protein